MNSLNGRARRHDVAPITPTRVLAALLAALLAVGLVMTEGAQAVQPGSHNGRLVTATSPVSWTPHVLDGYVESFAEVGNTVVVGGNFTEIRSAQNPTVIPRNHIFSFQKNSGTINSGFSPNVNGQIMSVLSAGDGQNVFIAGGFSQLNGQTVRSVAKVNLATGQRVAQFNPPAINGRVHEMQLRNGKLYLSGRFTAIGGQPHTLVAAVDPVTGAVDPGVKPVFSDPRRDGSLSIISSDITPDGSKMVAIGNFTKVDGLDRYQIVVLDLTTNPVSVANWSTNRYGDGCSRSFQSYMRDLDISPDGTAFAVATTGAYAAPSPTSYLCDTLAKWDLTKTGSSLQPEWADYPGGDTLTEVAYTDTAIYTGGHYSYMNNPYVGDSIAAGAAPREALSAHDPRSGVPFSWNPGRTRAYGVYDFLATDTGLWIGSDTDRIANFQYRGRLAFMPLTGVELPPDHAGTLPAQVVSLGLMQGGGGSTLDRTTSRTFTGTSVSGPATTAAGTSQWRNLRGAFMVDGKLYTGWSDRTFKVQEFNGSTFGAQSDVPLQLVPDVANSLNRFSTQDLATITGMFYDPATARIYFTKSGSNRLHYRGFSTESQVVGAQRVESSDGAGGVTWSGVQTMFMANNKLYTSGTNGNLVRRDWNPTTGLPVAGTATTVSGPGIDGQDWRARDAFVYAGAGFVAPNDPPVAAFTSDCTGATCNFDASTSSDPDGSITAWSWNFGDGSSPGTGATASHVYSATGTYSVTLTVTDNRGDSTSLTTPVEVTVPNQAPTANFTSTCDGLECSFDSGGSSDPDGSIVGRSWDFGDGRTSSAANPVVTYAAAGSYDVSLTVTDDQGATNTKTSTVSVLDPNATASVTFRAVNSSNLNSSVPSVNVPAATQPGDLLVLIATTNSSTATTTGPAGWTLLDQGTDATTTTTSAVWTKVATAADIGAVTRVTNSAALKTSLHVLAYEGASQVSAHALGFDTVSRTDRTTPTVPVTTAGSTVISYWADKSSDSTGWTLPGDTVVRDQSVGSGSGRIVAAVSDNGPLATGDAGGMTATSSSLNRRGNMWSIVLAPQTGPGNTGPTASFTADCTALSCSFDAAASADPDGTITGYSWAFGDGGTGTGVTQSRTYATPGTYTASLTVTDDKGATATTTRQVVVAEASQSNVAFRAAAGVSVNSSIPTVTVPSAVQAGDRLVLIATTNSSTATTTGPAGWTLVGQGTNTTTTTTSAVWTKVATAADAGAAARVTNSAIAKTALQVAAYHDAGAITAHELAFDTVNGAARTTPVVPVATNGSLLVSYWADKSSATTTWATPAGTELRNLAVGEGSGRIVAALADSGSLAAGTAGGLTATADSENRRAAMWSIVIAPA